MQTSPKNTFAATLIVLFLCAPATRLANAQEESPPKTAPAKKPMTVEQLVTFAKPSLVVITSATLRGGKRGVGTGFIIDAEGLIATNLHVVGEGQSFSVETSDGRRLPVRAVHASDRFLDLAILQVEPGDKPLPALKLVEPKTRLADGAEIVVMGNPHGLKNSVVRGVLSGRREVNGKNMIQLAIPIEPGNSGGPVLDMLGRVHGVVTMKSTVTENLGFAMETAYVSELLAKPNPVSFANWQSIGRLDSRRWKTHYGSDWRELGGRVLVRNPGSGFGGRSFCVSQREVPKPPYEVGVTVKLDSERSAAGLILHADGDRHYGFYPSSGKIRFTAFLGPTVFNWRILHDAASPHYRAGQWNHLKVRVEKDKMSCFVNDELVFTTSDKSIPPGKIGLAKFRDTVAEFKSFELADKIASKRPAVKVIAQVQSSIDSLPSLGKIKPAEIEKLSQTDQDAIRLLIDKAKRLEKEAEELRRMSKDVHVRAVVRELQTLVKGKDEDIDILRGALLIARADDPDVDVDAYVETVERMAQDVRRRTMEGADDVKRLQALNDYLFTENGFHGSRTEYNHPAKRYMNRVIDDRNGLPIMLSALYMEIGRRLGLKIVGVGMPGHFLVRHHPDDKSEQLIDVFDQAKKIDRRQAAELLRNTRGIPLEKKHLKASTKREMLIRMLVNLGVLANEQRDVESLLRYLELTLAVDSSLHAVRLDRARIRYVTGRKQAALDDLEWLVKNRPDGVDLRQAEQMRDFIRSEPESPR